MSGGYAPLKPLIRLINAPAHSNEYAVPLEFKEAHIHTFRLDIKKTKAAIKYFGNPTLLARALRIKSQSIYDWGADVPLLRQYQLERITNGKLKVGRG